MLARAGRRKENALVPMAELSALMGQLRCGDASALVEIYHATLDRVYAQALRIAGNPADADEVTCDVYHQVWRTAERFDAKRGSPMQWLMVICRTRALDVCRRRRLQRQSLSAIGAVSYPEHSSMVEDAIIQMEALPTVKLLLPCLSEPQMRVIGLAFFDGLSHREIAHSTGLSLGTVKSHLCRGMLVLRKALRTCGAAGIPRP